MLYWNPHRKGRDKREKIYLGDYYQDNKGVYFMTHPQKREVEEYLDQEFGLTYKDLLDQNGFYKRMLVNIHFFVELERRVNEEQKKQGFFTAE